MIAVCHNLSWQKCWQGIEMDVSVTHALRLWCVSKYWRDLLFA